MRIPCTVLDDCDVKRSSPICEPAIILDSCGDQDSTSMGLLRSQLEHTVQTVLPSPVAGGEALGKVSGSKIETWDAANSIILPIHPSSTNQHYMCSHSADRPLSISCTIHKQ